MNSSITLGEQKRKTLQWRDKARPTKVWGGQDALSHPEKRFKEIFTCNWTAINAVTVQ